jgi:hypothetical protein
MVDEMVNTALKLPQEIERVAEVEAFELNSVITGNRRAHAELMARMEKEDIMEQVTAREKVRMGENQSCTATTTNAVLSVTRFTRRSGSTVCPTGDSSATTVV